MCDFVLTVKDSSCKVFFDPLGPSRTHVVPGIRVTGLRQRISFFFEVTKENFSKLEGIFFSLFLWSCSSKVGYFISGEYNS